MSLFVSNELPTSTSASGKFGVIKNANGISSFFKASMAGSLNKCAPPFATMTGSMISLPRLYACHP